MAVPAGPGHRLGDLGQAAERLAIPGEALFQDHDPLELAVPFSHQQSADLQADAVARLRRAAVERSADAIVFSKAKDPSDRLVETAECVRLEPIGQPPHQQPAWKMGRRFAAQVGAPLTAQPIKIEALKIGNDRQKGSIERQRSAQRCRHWTLRRPPGVRARAGHADYAGCVAFRLGPRPSIASRCSTVRSPI
jgi:hypothetical protein